MKQRKLKHQHDVEIEKIVDEWERKIESKRIYESKLLNDIEQIKKEKEECIRQIEEDIDTIMGDLTVII